MGEWADAWSSQGMTNLWGTVPMYRGDAIGSVEQPERYMEHCRAGSMTTTFTASQGLLLMIPNLYKIAGELTSVQ